MEEPAHEIDYGKKWENLGISNDFIFGKVMQDAELCKGLLQRILPNLEIDHIEYPQAQKSIRPDVDAKSIRIDVYVHDGKGTVYSIEMQAADTRELPKRTRYYQSMIDLQMIDKGQHYKQLKPCYIIFICPFDLFGQGRHIYTFENICREDNHIFLQDGTAKIFLNAQSSRDDVSRELRAFLDYVMGQKSEDAFVKKLEEAVNAAKQNREWRREYMTLLMRDIENVEKGIEKGEIYGAISVYREIGLPDYEISQRIQKKYGLTKDEADSYLQQEKSI
ncbi:MAG: Rpn family recombination-promoting nuclease/putative transposase [Lachnospiraceae bacterium]|nr:Rpn family recombination-promoting nuclease/putative transposase [Lachnospiraceae bacterium]